MWLWSLLRLVFGLRRLNTEWQVGDGREESAAQFVLANARKGDVDDAIRAIDEYARSRQILINVGDEKGVILDAMVAREKPKLMLELGAYVGYSALRIARLLPPGGHLVSVEINTANAGIASRIIAHAGVADRVTFISGGSLADGGATMKRLEDEYGFGPGRLDAAFIDHDKALYLADLRRILERGWLRIGGVVVADNIRFPGAPEYRRYMRDEEGKRWRTTTHKTHVEYVSFVPDIVLESTLLA
jgi:catechol O-methyltransferase